MKPIERQSELAAHADRPDSTAQRLLATIDSLLAESRQERAPPAEITLDMDFERDLGLDSLARVELLSRIERRFGVALEDRVYGEARTPRTLLDELSRAENFDTTQQDRTPPPHPEHRKASAAPHSLETLVEVLEWHAEHHPERTHIRLYEDNKNEKTISYNGLFNSSRRIACGLQSLGLRPGAPVVLMLDTEPDYFFCFFGILLAGGVPVPIYPPARPDQIEDHLRRQIGILDNCAASMLITMPAAKGIARLLQSHVETLDQVVTPADLAASASAPFARPAVHGDDLAFLQYTSGSTGDPRGVMLSHANLLANIRAMAAHLDAGPDDVVVSWLPLYHDLGLIGAWLGSLYCAAELVVMSPLSFITRPRRWLEAIHRHRATISGAPNFGYELCLQRISDEELAGFDLGTWRIAFNGAEPVSPETMLGFRQRFAGYGLRPEALMPVYGLAECSVGLTFPPLGRGLHIDRVRRDPLARSGEAVPVESDDEPSMLRFVSCGSPLAGHEIRIVDDSGERELPERRIGRLQFRGPSATRGYYRNKEDSRLLLHGGWLDSGDLAYIADGEVFLTGRSKDIIIHAGRNLYPNELEEAIGRIDGVRAGRVAVFGAGGRHATERLVIVAETRIQDPEARQRLRQRIQDTVSGLSPAPADDLVLALPGAVLKTPSGKVRRAACRERYERGEIDKPAPAAWRQLLRLIAAAVPRQLRRFGRLIIPLSYSAWVHAIFWPTAALTWCAVVALLPSLKLRWKVMQLAAGFLLRIAGVGLRIQGLQHLPRSGQPCVCIANHASYLDSLLLVRALPWPVSFVAKAELRDNLFARLFLQRIGAVFVERFNARRGASDVQSLTEQVRQGDRLLIFPEGTFTRAPGLRPFRMGAFVTAARTGTPLFPIALRGSRSLLRADSWRPNRGEVTVTFLPLIEPALHAEPGDQWSQALALRTAAYQALLEHCGEPALQERQAPWPPS